MQVHIPPFLDTGEDYTEVLNMNSIPCVYPKHRSTQQYRGNIKHCNKAHYKTHNQNLRENQTFHSLTSPSSWEEPTESIGRFTTAKASQESCSWVAACPPGLQKILKCSICENWDITCPFVFRKTGDTLT